jgi:hypothetical protein
VSSTSDSEKRFGSDSSSDESSSSEKFVDAYFSADVETDGPIPGPYSILSLALVYAGRFDGIHFERPKALDLTFYRELKPISESFEPEALLVNGLDREELIKTGQAPNRVMSDASKWVRNIAGSNKPVLVAYPLSFDWSWLYWYFIRFSDSGSPFGYSRCFDIKTAVAVKTHLAISNAGRNQLPKRLRSDRDHSHNALDDAIEQAEIFSKVFELGGADGRGPRNSSK